MKAWRRSGGLGAALGVSAPTEVSLAAPGGEILTAEWLWGPGNPDFFVLEVRYDGGPWNLVQDDISGTDRTLNVDATGHTGELGQVRMAARIGGQVSSWTESNSEIVVN